MTAPKNVLIGVISDTHGLLRPEVSGVFESVEMIIHAGDVGKPEILEQLNTIAPVTAVRGNMDYGAWANHLSAIEIVEVSKTLIFAVHDIYTMDMNPQSAGFQVVISGHTHQPEIKTKDGILYLNPGSAGPRRPNRPVSVALLRIQEGVPTSEIIVLKP